MVWTRRRCAQCGQILVEEEHIIASCPACDAKVGPESVIPQEPEPAEPEVEDEPLTATPDEDDVESQLPPNWNLGEPMHRVFWLCLFAPDRVPLATMFRSLRWVFSMACLVKLSSKSFLIIGAAMLQAGSQELRLLKDIALAIEHSEQEDLKRDVNAVAQEQLCTLTMITPEQRLMCALQPALRFAQRYWRKTSQRIKAVEQLRGPQHLDAWLRTIGDGVSNIFFAFDTTVGFAWLGVTRKHGVQPSKWSPSGRFLSSSVRRLVHC